MAKSKNRYEIIGDTLVVYTRKHNVPLFFDASDHALILEHTWHIDFHGYVHTNIPKGDGRYSHLPAHVLITNRPKGLSVDHIDGNTLNNRRSNLRVVTHQENHQNRRTAKGYYWCHQRKKWKAVIGVNGKQLQLGFFQTEQEAYQCYLNAKKQYHPATPKDYFE